MNESSDRYWVFMYVEINLTYSALHNFIWTFDIFGIQMGNLCLVCFVLDACVWQRIVSILEMYLLNLATLSILFTRLKRFICPMWTFATFSETVSKNGSFSCKVERACNCSWWVWFWLLNIELNESLILTSSLPFTYFIFNCLLYIFLHLNVENRNNA